MMNMEEYESMNNLEQKWLNSKYIDLGLKLDFIKEEKQKWIRNKKIDLYFKLLVMRLAQIMSFISVSIIYIGIWYFFFSKVDVLELLIWWFFTGIPISMVLWSSLDKAIKSYKKTSLKKIYKIANHKFNLKEE